MKIASIRWVKPVIWVIELVIIVSLAGSIISLAKKKDVVGERAAVLGRVSEENDRLKRALSEAQGTEFVEKEARNKLGFVKSGETIVIVGKRERTPSDALKGQPTLSRWKEWWQLFF